MHGGMDKSIASRPPPLPLSLACVRACVGAGAYPLRVRACPRVPITRACVGVPQFYLPLLADRAARRAVPTCTFSQVIAWHVLLSAFYWQMGMRHAWIWRLVRFCDVRGHTRSLTYPHRPKATHTLTNTLTEFYPAI